MAATRGEHGGVVVSVELSHNEASACVHLIGSLIRERTTAGRPTPHNVLCMYQRLNAAINMSPRGQSKVLRERELDQTKIGTRPAAEILGWHVRRVRRHTADLGGQLVGDRLMFDEHRVREYAKALQDKERPTA